MASIVGIIPKGTSKEILQADESNPVAKKDKTEAKAKAKTNAKQSIKSKKTEATTILNKPSNKQPTPTAKDSFSQKPTQQTSDTIFQAIGVIAGDVTIGDDGKASISIGKKNYPLFYVPYKKSAFYRLCQEIKNTGKSFQRLVVYPKIVHFPDREKKHIISFYVVAFDQGQSDKGAVVELNNNEFRLQGLWQFIPVCRTPCISVLRNYKPELLKFIKQAESLQRTRILKASHIPLIWRDTPIKPFRFNPKAEPKDQGRPLFVQIKARFCPKRNTFIFSSLLAPPMEKAPRFLKVKKEDKLLAQKTKDKSE